MSPESPSESSRSEDSAVLSAEPFLYAPAVGENSSLSSKPAAPLHDPAKINGDRANGSHSEQRAYEKGLAEGEARARASIEKLHAEGRSQITEAMRQFTSQRDTYFEKVESEVVQLALSIARKILHRESQIDPLLLTGVVRVALEGLDRETQVRLRTNPEEVRFWKDYFVRTQDIRPVPELVGDASLGFGYCTIETDLGSTVISFETQLKEIEQGFLDLLGQRPRVNE
jgi:flagellar assembly protein FliH